MTIRTPESDTETGELIADTLWEQNDFEGMIRNFSPERRLAFIRRFLGHLNRTIQKIRDEEK